MVRKLFSTLLTTQRFVPRDVTTLNRDMIMKNWAILSQLRAVTSSFPLVWLIDHLTIVIFGRSAQQTLLDVMQLCEAYSRQKSNRRPSVHQTNKLFAIGVNFASLEPISESVQTTVRCMGLSRRFS
jgi:hypothetical protein